MDKFFFEPRFAVSQSRPVGSRHAQSRESLAQLDKIPFRNLLSVLPLATYNFGLWTNSCCKFSSDSI